MVMMMKVKWHDGHDGLCNSILLMERWYQLAVEHPLVIDQFILLIFHCSSILFM